MTEDGFMHSDTLTDQNKVVVTVCAIYTVRR